MDSGGSSTFRESPLMANGRRRRRQGPASPSDPLRTFAKTDWAAPRYLPDDLIGYPVASGSIRRVEPLLWVGQEANSNLGNAAEINKDRPD